MTWLAEDFARAWAARRESGTRRRGVVYRNLDTPESRAFWELSPRAKEVESWPDWKKAGMDDPLRGVPDCDIPKTYCECL